MTLEQNSNASYSNTSHETSPSTPGVSDMLLDMVGWKIGMALSKVLGPVVSFIAKLFFKIIILGLMFSMYETYRSECIRGSMSKIHELVGIAGLIMVIALFGYNIYRSIKGKSRISTKIFIIETIALSVIYFISEYFSVEKIPDCILFVLLFAFSLKVVCDSICNVISFIRLGCQKVIDF